MTVGIGGGSATRTHMDRPSCGWSRVCHHAITHGYGGSIRLLKTQGDPEAHKMRNSPHGCVSMVDFEGE